MEPKELLKKAADALLAGDGMALGLIAREATETAQLLEVRADGYRAVADRVMAAQEGMRSLAEGLMAGCAEVTPAQTELPLEASMGDMMEFSLLDVVPEITDEKEMASIPGSGDPMVDINELLSKSLGRDSEVDIDTVLK